MLNQKKNDAVTLLSDAQIKENNITPQIGFAPEQYFKRLQRLRQNYMEYPYQVAIGLFAQCNASCNFCPYPDMDNKGEKISTDAVFKMLDEISTWPLQNFFSIKFQHVSEPFLDKRIFSFAHYVNEKIPNAHLGFVSNGTTLNDKVMDKLLQLKNVQHLGISFNDHRKTEYEQVMQVPFDRTCKILDRLHERYSNGEIYFPITLSRVGDNTHADQQFLEWCADRYPEFPATSTVRADWLGAVQTDVFPTWDAGCGEWFTLRVLQNGKSAFCCMDSDGSYGSGSTTTMSLHEIYNQPIYRSLRENLPSRLSLKGCDNCPLMN